MLPRAHPSTHYKPTRLQPCPRGWGSGLWGGTQHGGGAAPPQRWAGNFGRAGDGGGGRRAAGAAHPGAAGPPLVLLVPPLLPRGVRLGQDGPGAGGAVWVRRGVGWAGCGLSCAGPSCRGCGPRCTTRPAACARTSLRTRVCCSASKPSPPYPRSPSGSAVCPRVTPQPNGSCWGWAALRERAPGCCCQWRWASCVVTLQIQAIVILFFLPRKSTWTYAKYSWPNCLCSRDVREQAVVTSRNLIWQFAIAPLYYCITHLFQIRGSILKYNVSLFFSRKLCKRPRDVCQVCGRTCGHCVCAISLNHRMTLGGRDLKDHQVQLLSPSDHPNIRQYVWF